MPTSTLSSIAIGIAILLFFITRQVLPRRISRFSFLAIPVIALYGMIHALPGSWITVSQLIELVISLVLAASAGILQAKVTRVFRGPDELLYMQGGWRYAGIWVLLVAIRASVLLAFNHGAIGSSTWILWASLATVWILRCVVLLIDHPEIREELLLSRWQRLERVNARRITK